MAKLKLEFEGFEQVTARLKQLEGNLTGVTEKALTESRDLVSNNLHTAMAPHRRTGRTEGAIVDNSGVEWAGSVASIEVGFDLEKGGLPSIFLMHGTKPHKVKYFGTPRLHPGQRADKNLYNAVYGGATQRKVRQIQEDIFYAEIRKLGG